MTYRRGNVATKGRQRRPWLFSLTTPRKLRRQPGNNGEAQGDSVRDCETQARLGTSFFGLDGSGAARRCVIFLRRVFRAHFQTMAGRLSKLQTNSTVTVEGFGHFKMNCSAPRPLCKVLTSALAPPTRAPYHLPIRFRWSDPQGTSRRQADRLHLVETRQSVTSLSHAPIERVKSPAPA
jgi:hypothetical protein